MVSENRLSGLFVTTTIVENNDYRVLDRQDDLLITPID